MEEIRPIFIIGAPRSGTSIMTWALGQHPNIQPMPETAWIASMAVGAYLSHSKGSERGSFSHLSNVEFPIGPFMTRIGTAINAIVYDVFAQRRTMLYGRASLDDTDWKLEEKQSGRPMQIIRKGTDPKRRWIDGTPLNSFYIWGLAELFPKAQFIHNLRRPDEVATSLEAFDKVGAQPQELEQGLEIWTTHTENAWYAECGLGSTRAFRMDFERISTEPEVLFRELCGFLGEDYSPDCLLPLQRKLNSSEVADKREANRMLLRGNPAFQHAQSVYDLVSQRPPAPELDEYSLGVIRERFQDYCKDRSLL